ncbi:dethiobiotin synthase [Thermocrispum municipale]|uniref:dethiobiotin synthase n=1 Tax=Thermocrispum municipale TaxID=37926 RepID=UPI0004170524|nr:dethiobiotin synthase [Thermocrispum municipale]
MSLLVITGTDTGVGKTVVTAAVAALAVGSGQRVAVVKPAQTGVGPNEAGDVDVVRHLAGPVTTKEIRRYPDPLAPDTAARRSGLPPVTPAEAAAAAGELAETHDLVLVEGAGGLLVRMDHHGGSLADVAWALAAPLIVVARSGLGTLNATALTAEVATRRGLDVAGVVVGSWPEKPDLAERCNIEDLPNAAGAPLLGVLPEGMGELTGDAFTEAAAAGLSPWLGGTFDPERFTEQVLGA